MTIDQTPSTKHYQGWRYTYDHSRTPAERWVATCGNRTITRGTERGLQWQIDDALEEATA